jgi:hypothetical protein
MPVDEDTMSIGAMVGTKEERQMLARKSIDFVCEHCGAISGIVKEKIPPLTEESAKAEL